MTAWELDTRPSRPCVVCNGEPDRTVRLPRLPEVHRAFGSEALCSECAAAARANDVAELTRRACVWSGVTYRWSDDRWDWALSVWPHNEEPVDPADLIALRRTLS